MTTFFARTNNGYLVVNPMTQNNISQELPPGIYEYQVETTLTGVNFHFIEIESFKMPSKILGDVVSRSKTTLHSYENTDKNMGVLFSGIGGTGKSLTAKYICNKAVEIYKYPVILIRDIETLSFLPTLLTQLPERAVIFIDEYEKLFKNQKEQNQLLSYLDGITDSKYLYLLTINKIDEVNEHLLSRPGRIRYHFKYNQLDTYTAFNAIKDRVYLTENTYKILPFLNFIKGITYDIVDAIATEMNLYPDTQPIKLLEDLNINGLSNSNIDYDDYFHIDIGINNKLSMDYIKSIINANKLANMELHGDNYNFYIDGSLAELSDLSRLSHSSKLNNYKHLFNYSINKSSYDSDESFYCLISALSKLEYLRAFREDYPFCILNNINIYPTYDEFGNLYYNISSGDIYQLDDSFGNNIFNVIKIGIIYKTLSHIANDILFVKYADKLDNESIQDKSKVFNSILLDYINPEYRPYFESYLNKLSEIYTLVKEENKYYYRINDLSLDDLLQLTMDSFKGLFDENDDKLIIKMEPISNKLNLNTKENKEGEPKKD